VQFVDREFLAGYFRGRSVAIVGSGPGAAGNADRIEACDIVVRVNNYKLTPETGKRCDVHYAFYGSSIGKSVRDLKRDGVTLCMCKCPNGQPIESEWHRKNKKMLGIDFRYIYRLRESYWFCPTYVPSSEEFRESFALLGNHIPSTGFSAIWTILGLPSGPIFVTGFDFFTSGIHNLDEPWRHKNTDDPIGHRPDIEKAQFRIMLDKDSRLSIDKTLQGMMK